MLSTRSAAVKMTHVQHLFVLSRKVYINFVKHSSIDPDNLRPAKRPHTNPKPTIVKPFLLFLPSGLRTERPIIPHTSVPQNNTFSTSPKPPCVTSHEYPDHSRPYSYTRAHKPQSLFRHIPPQVIQTHCHMKSLQGTRMTPTLCPRERYTYSTHPLKEQGTHSTQGQDGQSKESNARTRVHYCWRGT